MTRWPNQYVHNGKTLGGMRCKDHRRTSCGWAERWVWLGFSRSAPGRPDGSAQLRIEVVAAYNLVVDSNLESPSTYALRSAYFGAICHDGGTNLLTDVWGCTPAANFSDYARGAGEFMAAELPEFGCAVAEDGFVLRWKRRIHRADVEYRLFLSHDLTAWSEDATQLEELGTAPDSGGVMETVRTRVKQGAAERTYLGIQAKKK